MVTKLIDLVRVYLELLEAKRMHKARCPFPREKELRAAENELRARVRNGK